MSAANRNRSRGILKGGSLCAGYALSRKGGDPQSLAKMLPQKKILYTFCVVGMRAKTAAYALEKHVLRLSAI